jgi:hypothetical protein
VVINSEMHQVLEFCTWKEAWWMNQVPLLTGLPEPLAEGLKAYTAEQADLEWCIHMAWLAKWACVQELAWPIIAAVMGDDSTVPMPDAMQGIEAVAIDLELDIEEEHEAATHNSDFEE